MDVWAEAHTPIPHGWVGLFPRYTSVERLLPRCPQEAILDVGKRPTPGIVKFRSVGKQRTQKT